MKRRTALLAPLFALVLATPAAAERISLNELSRYLNGLKTVVSDFTQINADGTISTGTVYISRPGRVRFEYAPPDKTLVMAGGGQVAVFDGKSNQAPEQYPLSRTPLSIILADNVNLGQARMVTQHREEKNTTTVTAQDPAHPEYGNIKMVFTAKPTELRQWVVTDNTGQKTTVILGDLKKGVEIGPSRFSIPTEVNKRR
ncbi:outer membrane lipoprotein carrier protein LolA [Paracoccus sp. p3-h83]|uniref:LolA family protein n=1 Tax=Paracoccus sp. p3-h83 TaxID=3342805 RepID=UPI0035B7AA01